MVFRTIILVSCFLQLGKEFAYGLPQDEYWLPPAGTGDISLTLDLDVENLGTKPYAPSSPVATSGIVGSSFNYQDNNFEIDPNSWSKSNGYPDSSYQDPYTEYVKKYESSYDSQAPDYRTYTNQNQNTFDNVHQLPQNQPVASYGCQEYWKCRNNKGQCCRKIRTGRRLTCPRDCSNGNNNRRNGSNNIIGSLLSLFG